MNLSLAAYQWAIKKISIQSLCLLTGAFSLFTFKAVSHRYVLIAILFIVNCFSSSVPFSFSYSPFVIWWLSLALCLDSFLFICVPSIGFGLWLRWGLYVTPCVYTSYILSWWLYNFEHSLKHNVFYTSLLDFIFISFYI